MIDRLLCCCNPNGSTSGNRRFLHCGGKSVSLLSWQKLLLRGQPFRLFERADYLDQSGEFGGFKLGGFRLPQHPLSTAARKCKSAAKKPEPSRAVSSCPIKRSQSHPQSPLPWRPAIQCRYLHILGAFFLRWNAPALSPPANVRVFRQCDSRSELVSPFSPKYGDQSYDRESHCGIRKERVPMLSSPGTLKALQPRTTPVPPPPVARSYEQATKR